MDFPASPEFFDASWAPLVTVIGFAVIVVFLVTATCVSGSFRVDTERLIIPLVSGVIVGGLAFLVGLVSLIVSSNSAISARADWKVRAIAEVEETYGIELSGSEFAALQFPMFEPEDEFVAFGSIDRTEKSGDAFEKRELTLIWSDGELFLAESVDGEEFVPLEAR